MSKDHAYAYEAGYRDGSVHYELEHCPACKNVADLQEALEENAALRQQLADVTESTGRVEERCAKLREQIHWLKQGDILHVLTDQEYIDQCERERQMQVSIDALDKENAELRELVRDLLHHIEYPPCEGCLSEMSCAGDLSQCDEYFDWLKPRARKLGVEVDE